jgi:hypothetical protein
MIESNFKSQLMNVTSLTTDKVFFVRALKDTPAPYITITTISSPRGLTHDGSDETAVSRIQVSVFATTYAELKSLCAEVYTLHGTSADDVAIIELVNEIDLWDGNQDILSTAIDFTVRHYEHGGN